MMIITSDFSDIVPLEVLSMRISHVPKEPVFEQDGFGSMMSHWYMPARVLTGQNCG